MGMADGMTPRYCAPEVAQHCPRGTSSDIWSLGVVFLEMVVVLKGKDTSYMEDFFQEYGPWQALILTSPNALPDLIKEFKSMGKRSDDMIFGWVEKMLSLKQDLRPTASSLVAAVTTRDGAGSMSVFCGICCAFPEGELTDYEDE